MRLNVFVLILGLLALAGCPKPASKTNVDVSTTSSGSTQVVETPEQTADATTPPGTEAKPAEGQPAVPGGEATGETAHKPSAKELQGKWFALYGGVGMGAKTYSYDNGHQLEFLANGMAIWDVSGKGDAAQQVVSKWDATSGDITVTVDKPDSLSGDSFKSTPLAFGRDDEVGLTAADGKAQPAVFRFTPEMDGGFLALKGMRGELMVYGRVDNAVGANVPDVSGDWVLVSAPGQQDDVKVTVTGNTMETSWGAYHSTFKGNYSRGYFIGMVTSTAGNAYAAVTPGPNGTLDGVISTEPFDKWQSTFDFTRASK
jgi:hypothetical protein